jgi:hypothetical protein
MILCCMYNIRISVMTVQPSGFVLLHSNMISNMPVRLPDNGLYCKSSTVISLMTAQPADVLIRLVIVIDL